MNSARRPLPGSLSINFQQIASFPLPKAFSRGHFLISKMEGGRNITLGRLGLPKTTATIHRQEEVRGFSELRILRTQGKKRTLKYTKCLPCLIMDLSLIGLFTWRMMSNVLVNIREEVKTEVQAMMYKFENTLHMEGIKACLKSSCPEPRTGNPSYYYHLEIIS